MKCHISKRLQSTLGGVSLKKLGKHCFKRASYSIANNITEKLFSTTLELSHLNLLPGSNLMLMMTTLKI